MKAELLALAASKKMRNVRESRISDIAEKEGYLCDHEFDNNKFSHDELHLAAVLMLERSAPFNAFSDKHGLNVLFDFVDSLRQVYRPNPYHDFRHAVDVMQFMYHLLSCRDIANQALKNPQNNGDELKFMLLVACVCHDAGHDGTSNKFHRTTQSDLFQKFGEESVLERMHYSHAENMIDESELLDVLKDTGGMVMDRAQFLDAVRGLILSTDMEKHNAVLATFKASPTTQLFNVLIKLADISNVTRPFEEARIWAKRLEAEMKVAAAKMPGQEEQPSSLPLPQTVIGFSKMFALPMIDSLQEAGLQASARSLRARVESNIAKWEQVDEHGCNPGL